MNDSAWLQFKTEYDKAYERMLYGDPIERSLEMAATILAMKQQLDDIQALILREETSTEENVVQSFNWATYKIRIVKLELLDGRTCYECQVWTDTSLKYVDDNKYIKPERAAIEALIWVAKQEENSDK